MIKKWEYKMITITELDELGESYSDRVKGKLALLGKLGWEMCGIAAENDSSEWQVFFKREITESLPLENWAKSKGG